MLATCCHMYYTFAQAAHYSSICAYDKNCDSSYITGVMAAHLIKDGDYSSILGDAIGINIYGTTYDLESGEITLSARYKLKPLIDMFHVGVKAKTVVKTRAYIGGKMITEAYDASGMDGTTVYVAENGVVYHKNRECAYIDITVNIAKLADIVNQRNSQGGKYYSCELCSGYSSEGVTYITENGNRYHKDANCSGIRRTVYEMKIGDDCPLPACSRCGG